LAAWTALKKEFGVQKMIWESVALMKKAQMAAAGKASGAGAQEPAEAILLKDFEQLLNQSSSDADGAVRALESTLQRDREEYNLLSKSMLDVSRAAIKGEELARRRRTLAGLIEASPEGAEGSNRAASLEELTALLTACDLGRNKTAFCARRVLSWRLGAPASGLEIPLSAAWPVTDEDGEDPWAYDIPDPSVSPPGSASSAEKEKDVRRARNDLSSLKVKDKKKAESANATKKAVSAVAELPGEEPGPKPPPPARLPIFPRYALSDPLSWVPVACYPTGLTERLPSQRSTSAGGSIGSGAGSDGGSEEHRTRVYLCL
jgi:hypothetical protein